MSETVKLIIEISTIDRDYLNNDCCGPLKKEEILSAVKHGTPLDSNSEKAEVQAYFDGEAFGWDEGREALIEELKAEFIKLYPKNYMGEPYFNGIAGHFSLNNVLKILDNIGKESEERNE